MKMQGTGIGEQGLVDLGPGATRCAGCGRRIGPFAVALHNDLEGNLCPYGVRETEFREELAGGIGDENAGNRGQPSRVHVTNAVARRAGLA